MRLVTVSNALLLLAAPVGAQRVTGFARALTRPEGLRTRPWFRNLIYTADEDNGYSTIVFPSVDEALRRQDLALAGGEVADLTGRFRAAARELVAAQRALTPR